MLKARNKLPSSDKNVMGYKIFSW